VCAVVPELLKVTYDLVHSTNCGCKPVSVYGIATGYWLDGRWDESWLLRASVWLGCSRSEYSSGRKWKAVKWRQVAYVRLTDGSRRAVEVNNGWTSPFNRVYIPHNQSTYHRPWYPWVDPWSLKDFRPHCQHDSNRRYKRQAYIKWSIRQACKSYSGIQMDNLAKSIILVNSS
jgi:hypothetical protein